MIIARRHAYNPAFNNYWLVCTDNYGLGSYCNTIQDAFNALDSKDNGIFDITSQYIVKDGFIYDEDNVLQDIILVNHPTDLTYEEFCELYPELII